MKLLLELFWSFVQIGICSIGGGYAAVGLVEAQAVEVHGWITVEQFADLVTIAEMTPGPISLNAATFVGNQVAGLPGAVVATLGCAIPTSIIVLALAWLFRRNAESVFVKGALNGLRPAVVALVASAGVTLFLSAILVNGTFLGLSSIDWMMAALFAAALFVLRKWKVSPVIVMLGCGAVGGGIRLLLQMLGA